MDNANYLKILEALEGWRDSQEPEALTNTIKVEGLGEYNINTLIEEVKSGSEKGTMIVEKIAKLAIDLLFRK